MWICTQQGFYSIVQKKPGEFHIRARKLADLENLKRLSKGQWKIIETPDGDYRFRAVCGLDDVLKALEVLGRDLNYSNFKSRIHQRADQREKCDAYSDLWSALHALQER